MKRNSTALVALFCTIALGSVAHATEYTCEGTSGTKGSVSLTTGEKTVFLSGSYSNADSGDQEVAVHCKGTYDRQERNLNYYTTKKTTKCPADYVRVQKQVLFANHGVVSLVSRTGGDTHDNSGYTYAMFSCKKD